MATVNDVLELAKALEGKAVAPAAIRCVAVRNRKATCRRCVETCFANAISVEGNEIELDNGACVSCGACVTVCPVEALVPLEPAEEDLGAAVAAATMGMGGRVSVIACARAAARGDGDPDKFAAVPCLGRVGELLLVELAARGVNEIVLVDGDCSTCKYGAVVPAIEATIGQARELLSLAPEGRAKTTIERVDEFPREARLASEREQLGAARRSFLTNAGGMAKDAAVIAAEQAVAQRLRGNQEKRVATLREKLGVRENGKLPVFRADRNLRMLDALYELGVADGCDASGDSDEAFLIETRLFGSVSIDVQACTGCGMCTLFCPTGALRTSEEEHPQAEEELRYLEFSAADCVQCGLCADACVQRALTLSTEVDLCELFSFEPRLIDAKKPSKKPPLFRRRF